MPVQYIVFRAFVEHTGHWYSVQGKGVTLEWNWNENVVKIRWGAVRASARARGCRCGENSPSGLVLSWRH